MPTEHLLQLKVALQHVKPPVWRRILIPDDYSFWDLHIAIQDSMGWTDSHLHEFIARNPFTGDHDHIGYPNDEARSPTLPGWRVPVVLYLGLHCRKLIYAYDFGDDWRHSVQLEEIRPREPNSILPTCIAGKRRCPPEDCGGPPGYERLLEAVADKDHPEHRETLEWLGGPFDPNQFDPKAVRFDDPSERFELAFSDDD